MKKIQYIDLFLDQTKDLIWAVDKNFYLVYANKAYLSVMKEVTGVEKKLNTPILVEGFGEGYIEKWKAYYQRALSGERFEIEEHFYHPETKEMHYGHIAFSPIQEKTGEIHTVACRSTDITPIIRQKDHASRLMDASLDVFCTIDEGGKFVFVNAISADHWGYQPEELIGKPYRDLIVAEDIEKTDLVAAEIMAGKDFKSFSNRFRKKNGDIAYNLWSARWDQESKLMYCVARDAKEKIEEEQHLKLLEKVINSATDAILITEAEPLDEPGPIIVYANKAFTNMTGYTAEEVIGKNPRILQGPESNYGELKKLGEKLKNWESSEITVLNYTKSGEPFWVNFAVSPVANEKGWFTHWISIQREVTEQKKQEAEKELLSQISLSFNNERELILAARRLCENLYGFGKFDLIELWCPNMELSQLKLMGRSTHSQDFYELEPTDTCFKKDEGLPGTVWVKGKQVLWDEKQINQHFVRKKGASHLGLKAVLGIPLTFSDELVGVLLVGTKREPDYLKQYSPILSWLETFIGSEINRKRLENDLANVYDAIPEILCIVDVNGRFLKINNAGCALLGYAAQEVLFHPLDAFTVEEDQGKFSQKMKGISNDASVFTFENRFLTKDRQVIWLSWNCNPVLEEGLVYASAKNITAEVQLRELNSQAGSLAKIGSWEVDLEKSTVFWSKMVHQLHETDPDSFTPDLETAIDFYREDFRTLVQSSIEKSIATGEGFDFEAVIVTKKLKERWVRSIGHVAFANGVATRIYGSFQDISDRKEPELRLQSFADNLPGVAFQYYLYPDGTDVLKYVTDGSKKVWGFGAESVMRENNLVWKQIEMGGELDLVKKSIMNSLETKSDWKAQWRYITPTNELRIHAGYGSPKFLPDGTVVFNSLILDITEEYRSEELLKQASEMAKIGSWELNLVGQENDSMYWSPMTRRILEVEDSYDPSLTGGFEFYSGEYKEKIQQAVNLLIEQGREFDLELLIQTLKGQRKWIRCIGKAEFIDGKCVRIFGSFLDIHDRMTFVEALRESEAKFRTIFEIASLGIAQVSPTNGQILLVNSYYEEITGYSLKEMLQMKFPELTHPEDRERDWDLFSKAAKGEVEYRNEKRYIKKDGSIVWVRIHLAFIRDKEGNPVKTVAICENITDRKEIESRLISLSDNLPGVVFQYLLFPDGTDALRSVSKGSHQLWGYSPAEVEQDINLVWNQTKAGGEYEQVKQDIIHAVKTKSKWLSRYRSVLPNGEVRTFLGSGLPHFSADGTVLFNSLVLDITDEAKKEELLSDATQMARIGSWEVNFVKNNILWSDITHQLHETDPASFVPDLETSINFYRDDFREKVQSSVRSCIEDGIPFDFEAVIVTAKNNERWVRAIGRAEMINGQCQRLHGSFQDIHKLKIVEQQKNTLLTTLENSLNEIYVFDAQTLRFISVNKGARINLGYSEDELMALTPLNLMSEFNATTFNELITPLVTKEKEKIIFFTNHKRKNGSLYPVEVHLQFIEEGNNKRFLAIILDITDRKESEMNLLASLKSLEDYKFALDQTAIITITDIRGVITSVNDQFCKISKYSREELIGKTHKIINSGYHPKSFFADFWKTIARGKVFRGEIKNRAKDGSFYWVDTIIVPFLDENKKPFQYLAIRIDITAKKLANEKIIEILEEKNHILESIGDAFFAVNKEWTVTYWNKQAEIVLGKSKEDILGKNLWEEFPDAIDTDFYVQYQRAMETGETVNFEEYYPTLDIWVEVTVYPSENGLSIYFKDITLRKVADIRLLQANERFELVTKATNDAIWDWDIENDVFYRSSNIRRILGRNASTKLKKSQFWDDSFLPEDLGKLKESIQHALNDPQSERWEMEYRVLNDKKETLSIIDRGIIVRNKDGKPIRMVGAMTDLSRQKRLEKELFQLNESLKNYTKELERSNEELEQFAFITSHDLQEPLRMISSFMDQLKRKYSDQLDDKALQYIHFATDGAKRMKQIILDLLLYSRANKPSEQIEEVNLIEVISEYTLLRRKLIAEKKASIIFYSLPVLQTFMAPITQIVHCLLDNALKYSKENTPARIEIFATDKVDFWEFAVKDNGIGIDEKFHDKVFIIFQRLHNRNHYDGTGIGLSIAKRSVEFLGGEIWLESKESEGSVFYFTIPKK